MQPSITQPDAALVTAARNGDRDAFAALVQRYQNLICAIAYSRLGNLDTAHDIAQEAFLVTFETLPLLRSAAKFGPWLRRITLRLCTRCLRSERYRRSLKEQLRTSAHAQQTPTPQDIAQANETGATVRRAIHRLPHTLRDVLVLHYFQGQSHAETARTLGISQAAVGKRVERAKRRIRQFLTSEIETELRKAQPREDFTKRTLAAIPAGSICARLGLNVTKLTLAEALSELAQATLQHASTILTGGMTVTITKGTVTAAALALLAVAATGYLVVRYGTDAPTPPASETAAEPAHGVELPTTLTEKLEAETQAPGIGRSGEAKLDAEWLIAQVDKWAPGWTKRIPKSFLEDPKNAFNRYLLAASLMVGPEADPRFQKVMALLAVGGLHLQPRLEDPGTLALLQAYLAANAEALAAFKAGIQEAEYYQSPAVAALSTETPPYVFKFVEMASMLDAEALILNARGDIGGALSDSVALLTMGRQTISGASGHPEDSGIALNTMNLGESTLVRSLSQTHDSGMCRDALELLGELRSEKMSYSEIMRNNFELFATYFSDAEFLRERVPAAAEFPLDEDELQRQAAQIRIMLDPLMESADLPYPEFASLPDPEIPDDWLLGGAVDGIPDCWESLKLLSTVVRGTEAKLAAYETMAALKLHQLETGAFPQSLEELVPAYLAEIPSDPFSGEPLKYSRTENGAIVYSVGPDMQDNLVVSQGTGGDIYGLPSEGSDLAFELR